MKSKKTVVLSIIAGVLFFSATLLSAAEFPVTINIDAASYIRSIPETLFSTNTMCWDGKQNGGNDNYNNLMAASNRRYIRWPGGSWGDAYLWSDMESGESNTWIVSYDESMYMINKMGAIMQPIVNFPGYWYDIDHSDAEAIAAAVAWVQDQSSRIHTARYWEIGNEVFGPWEAGWFEGMRGSYYGDKYADFYTAMKAVNSDIKIGAVAQEYDTPDWWNPGLWTRELLNAAYAKDVIPDFLIIHQYPGTDQAASYNPTLLGHDVDEIANFTSSLDSIVTDTVGSQYVGKIKYFMTEWDCGEATSYQRRRCFINAMFHSQTILELAENGWLGSNQWSQWEVGGGSFSPSAVYPVWYVAPLLSNLFGRDMVEVLSSRPEVRAYAARNDANNLTVFIVNNFPSTDTAISINISGFNAGTNGERWLIEPAGTIVSGGSYDYDRDNIMINGATHPDPCNLSWLDSVAMTTGSSFSVSLARCRMIMIKIPPASPVQQSPYIGAAHAIPGSIEAENYDTGGQFTAYYDTTTGNSAGQYRSDDVDIETCGEGGYNVTNIKAGEWLEYTVDVESSGIYNIQARVASADVNSEFRIEFDGQDVTGPVAFSATGGAQTYTNVEVKTFLSIGRHTMRFLMDTDGWNINRISFTKLGGGTGKSLREWWTGISGTAVSNLTSNVNYPYNPTGRILERSFEGPTNWTNSAGTQLNSYGTHIRGYLNPITSGIYTFWIASDDASDLYLSTDSDPANKIRIAYVSSWVNPYKWTVYGTQQSSPISLVAGQSYFIEALHKEGSGGDSVAVAWEGPGIIRQAITGQYLAPYVIDFTDFTNFANQWYRTDCSSGNGWCSGADLTRNGSVTLDDLMQFVEDWWLFGAE